MVLVPSETFSECRSFGRARLAKELRQRSASRALRARGRVPTSSPSVRPAALGGNRLKEAHPAHDPEEHAPVVDHREDGELLPGGIELGLPDGRPGAKRHWLLSFERGYRSLRVLKQAMSRVDHAGQVLGLVEHVKVLPQHLRCSARNFGSLPDPGLRAHRHDPRVDERADTPRREAQHEPERYRHPAGERVQQMRLGCWRRVEARARLRAPGEGAQRLAPLRTGVETRDARPAAGVRW